MNIKSFLIVFAMVLVSSISYGQTADRARVAQGVRSGEITRVEAAKIAKEKQDVRQSKRIAAADGVVSPAEKQIIRKEKRQVNRTICRTKHNARDRN